MEKVKLKAGEMIIEKDRIVFVSVTSGYDNVPIITLFPEGYDSVQMILDSIRKNDPVRLSTYYYTISRRRKDCIIRTLGMGRLSVLQDYEIIEIKYKWWRKLLSYIKPIKLYIVKYTPKPRKFKFVTLYLRGIRKLKLL